MEKGKKEKEKKDFFSRKLKKDFFSRKLTSDHWKFFYRLKSNFQGLEGLFSAW
jgi:hypothetical protein